MAARLDRGLACLVLACWVAMTSSAGLFVARYGYNLPRQDEWEFVEVLTGGGGATRWVFARHAEHRFPLARAVYLGLHVATGRDFRAGMWLSVTLLSASSATLLLAARRWRGRSAPPDLLVPVLLLNAGHAENLTMGYQVAFTITVALLAGFVAVLAWADWLGPRRAAGLCGIATLGVALGGGFGLAFAPGLWLVTLLRVATACRQPQRRLRDAVALALAPALTATYVVASLVELASDPARPGNDLRTALGVAFDFRTVAFGGAGQVGYPLPGAVASGCVAEALAFATVALLTRSADRERIVGCAAVLVGAVLLSMAIGATRPLGNESRYGVFGALALCVVVVMRATPRPAGVLGGPGALLLPALAATIAWQDWRVGRDFAETYEVRTAMLNRDVRLGLPANLLAERHVFFPVPAYAHSFAALYSSGHKSLRGAGPPRALKTATVPLSADARLPAYDGVGPPPKWEVVLPEPLAMDALRLEFDCPEPRYREVYRLELPANPDESAGVTSVWLMPGRRTMIFRVEGTLGKIVVRPVERTAGLKLTRCEAIVFE